MMAGQVRSGAGTKKKRNVRSSDVTTPPPALPAGTLLTSPDSERNLKSRVSCLKIWRKKDGDIESAFLKRKRIYYGLWYGNIGNRFIFGLVWCRNPGW